MDRKDCRYWNECNAPLCPLDRGAKGIWYPDEDICGVRKYGKRTWIANQKKIAKRGDVNTYFTKKMLQLKTVIRTGIQGLDPEKDYNQRERLEQAWINARKSREGFAREMTPEQKQELVERFKKARENKKKVIKKGL